jgi:hypothetical protein
MNDAPVGCVLGCGRPAICRGLCVTHLRLARQRVRRGDTTWAQLEAAGQAWQPRPPRLPWGLPPKTAGAI